MAALEPGIDLKATISGRTRVLLVAPVPATPGSVGCEVSGHVERNTSNGSGAGNIGSDGNSVGAWRAGCSSLDRHTLGLRTGKRRKWGLNSII